MTELFRKSFKLSAVVHIAIIAAMIAVPMVLDCRRRKEPHEVVTFIDLQTAVPEPVAEAPPVAEPVVTPPPPEPPKDIPEPTPKPKRPKIEVSKKKVRREDETPPPPKKPQLSEEEIRRMLDAGAKPTAATTAAADDLPSWYYALVKQAMYDVWVQPSGLSASAGLVTTVSIRVERSGRVTRRSLVRSCGVAVMDDSVMKAVNSVSQLKPLPSSFRGDYKDITVYFELTQGL